MTMPRYEAVYTGTSPVRILCLGGREFIPGEAVGVTPAEAERAMALRAPVAIRRDGEQVWPRDVAAEEPVVLRPGEKVPEPGGQFVVVDAEGNVVEDREAGLNPGDPAPPLPQKGWRWLLVDPTRHKQPG